MATFRRLPSGQWQARVWHPGLKRYVSLGQTHRLKKVVERLAADEEQRIRRGQWVDPKDAAITLDQWWATWCRLRTVERSTAAKDASRWRTHVQPAFGSWTLAALAGAGEDLEAWVAGMVRDGVGGETVAGSVRLLTQLLDAARRHNRIAANPAAGLRAPTPARHVDRFLTRREAHTLRACLAGQDRLIVEVFLHTGLRWAELAGLHCFRLDLRGRRLMVVETLRRDGTVKPYPKSSAGQRVVPLTDRLARRLAAQVAGRASGALVFTGTRGRPLSYRNWRARVWAPAVARAGLGDPKPTIHDLRHTYGSWLAEAGVPAVEIRELMGHSSLRSVDRYLHASAARMDRARDALAVARSWHAPPDEVGERRSRRRGNTA